MVAAVVLYIIVLPCFRPRLTAVPSDDDAFAATLNGKEWKRSKKKKNDFPSFSLWPGKCQITLGKCVSARAFTSSLAGRKRRWRACLS